MIKLAALAALAYAGYRYLQGGSRAPQVRLAGGPLSEHATLQRSPDRPPAVDPYHG